MALAVGVAGPSGTVSARVSPLASIERQIQKPNMLILLDTSQSMFQLPGGDDQDFNEAGIDCDNGDAYCRVVGKKGRCFFTSSGKFGTGVRHDYQECTNDSQCTDIGYCKTHQPTGCRGAGGGPDSNGDDPDDDCDGVGGSCTNHICTGAPSGGIQTCNTNADCDPGEPCTKMPGNFCVLNTTTQATVKMCRLSQTMCLDDSHCQSIAGDSCGPASSRMVVAKRVLSRVVQEFRDSVNFGFMTFMQKGYFPYHEVTGALTSTTRETFLTRALLETASPACFSTSTGPTATCSLNGISYTRKASNNSRYRLNVGGRFATSDYSWGAAGPSCGVECGIPGVGTGIYEGSHYTFAYATATAIEEEPEEFVDYVGRTRVKSGKTYVYLDPSNAQRHVDNIYQKMKDSPFGSSGTCKALWNEDRLPFMDTSLALPEANATEMARKISQLTEKVGLGGLVAVGGTPIGGALKGDASCHQPADSAYHYLQDVQIKNANNGVACRPDAVLLVTDGLPGDADCSNPDCALSPPGPSCACTAVLNARAVYQDLGAKVYVVGFSGTVSTSAYATTITNNIARAGGTTSAYFALREEQLYQGITSAIYESARGSYSTSPLTGGSGVNGQSQVLLDARADFPEWRGHLVTYDVSGTSPQVSWDAATFFDAGTDPNFWKRRNVWTSEGQTMVKIDVAADGTINNAAKLRELGLATTDAEASLAARWLLGDPAMGNPAVLGAMINSSPIEVAISGGPSLIYIGASDGMLHAFHSTTQTVGGISYAGGQEAFAYIPQDMLPVVRRLFAQGGQRPAPRDHVFGLANSPKVKRICTANCNGSGGAISYKTVLIMPEGFGGNELFALDIGTPHGSSGILAAPGTPPVQLLWNTDTTVSAGDKAEFDGALGKTISLPAFFFAKSADMNDNRVVFASGYTDASSSAQGLAVVSASAATGELRSRVSAAGLGASCSKPRVDPTEPTLLADVAVARRFTAGDSERIAAGYVGDTWGNLFRWFPPTDATGLVQTGGGTLNVVESFTCSHPLHLPPTLVQLDRYDPSKSPGAIFVAQLTNSAHDPATSPQSAAWPASQLVIRKDITQPGGGVIADTSFNNGAGKITLSAANPAQICAVYNASSHTCTTAMPAGARPLSSAIGVLKADYDAFVLASLWYLPDSGGCNKGQTYLTIHEVSATGSVSQMHGEKIGDEPVIGAVFAAGKMYITRSDGPHAVTVPGLRTVVNAAASGERFRRTGWSELP